MRRGRRSSENRVKPVRRGAGRLATDAPLPFAALFPAMKTFLCSHLILLRWNGRSIAGNLEKISPAAALLNLEDALPEGAAVTIVAGDHELAGTVTGCEMDPLGYFIDIALEREWSEREFRPDHFFDPEILAAEPVD
jgi:hypothetical protein